MFECCKTKKKQKAFPSNFSWFVVVFFAFKVDRINWKSSYELNGNVIIQRNLEFFLVQQQNCISNTYKNETWKVIQIKEKKKFSIWFVERIYIIYIILSVVVHEDQEITVDWHNMLHCYTQCAHHTDCDNKISICLPITFTHMHVAHCM